MRRSTSLLCFALLPIAGCATPSGDYPDSAIGTAVYVGPHEVRPYDPDPALVTPVTVVPRAKFDAIDIHCHWDATRDAADLLRAMDERGVRAAVNLSGGFGPKLDEHLDRYHAAAPDRLFIFCNLDFTRIDDPDWGLRTAAWLESVHARGVRGLKIFKNLGLTVRDARGELVAVDDPRLDPVWAVCGRLGMPVLIHSADPTSFFEPIDEKNERWMQLRRHPDWSFYGPEFPDRETVLAQRDNVLRKHRTTNFIGAHIGSHAEDLATAAQRLESHPNLFYDISGRVGELGRQPYAARAFLTAYADRILFGTDRYPGRPDQPRYRIYFRFLETNDQYFKPYDHPFAPSGDWRIHGVFLPDDVLRKVYVENAVRLLGLRG